MRLPAADTRQAQTIDRSGLIAYSFSPSARAELAKITARYRDEASEKVANDFVLELGRALDLVRRFPTLGAPDSKRTRKLLLIDFPHALVYRIQDEHLRIIAIAHERKRIRFWRGRT